MHLYVCIYHAYIYHNALDLSQYPREPVSSVKTFSCFPPLKSTSIYSLTTLIIYMLSVTVSPAPPTHTKNTDFDCVLSPALFLPSLANASLIHLSPS